MQSFIFILQAVLVVLVLCECLASEHKPLQQHIYYIAFLWVVVWSTSKYAYGPDIHSYIPFYQSLGDPWVYIANPEHGFEKGFVFFCSLIKRLHFSFWGMTAVVSVLYFTAIGLLWRDIPRYKTVALSILVALDYNLILIELRQCLAISFFIFFVLCFRNKKYVLSAVFMAIAITMHKSMPVILVLLIILYALRGLSITKRDYIILSVLFILYLFVPLQFVWQPIVAALPFDDITLKSIAHHISVGDKFQKVMILYFATFICLAYYKKDEAQNKTLHWLMWCAAAVLMFFYPYWFLLHRLRSYILPFLIVYVAKVLSDEKIQFPLLRQCYMVVVVTYTIIVLFSIPKINSLVSYPTDNVSTVFERFNHSEQELVNRQMKQAELYWEYDYPRMLQEGKIR